MFCSRSIDLIGRISCFLLLAAVVAVLAPGGGSVAAALDPSSLSAPCASYFYRSQCLAAVTSGGSEKAGAAGEGQDDDMYGEDVVHRCQWCCSAPVGRQCYDRPLSLHQAPASLPVRQEGEVPLLSSSFSLYSSSSTQCPGNALILDVNDTCEDRCRAEGLSCAACEAMPWCIFCGAEKRISVHLVDQLQGTCAAPLDACPDSFHPSYCAALVYQEPSTSVLRVHRTLYIATIVVLCVGVFSVVWKGVVVRYQNNVKKAVRGLYQLVMRRWRQQPSEDREVLITAAGGSAVDTNSTPAEDQFETCCLCFDNPAVISFLPCHHVCCCEDCSIQLRPEDGSEKIPCPLCREPVTAMVSLVSLFTFQHSSDPDGGRL